MSASRVDQIRPPGGGDDGGIGGLALPDEVAVKRSDPIYNAHAYLTKVPVAAIVPFLEAFTAPGDIVLDMYGGSGMTGVAAISSGRQGEIRDISALGKHIGTNYLNLIEPQEFRAVSSRVVDSAEARIGGVYLLPCEECDRTATLSRTVWSFVYECRDCGAHVNYYESFRAARWQKAEMKCGSCANRFTARGASRVAEAAVFDTVSCECSSKLRDQRHTSPPDPLDSAADPFPGMTIGEERQMFQASALRRHGLLTTSSFFSRRNLVVLSTLREEIGKVEDEGMRSKLLFAFTGILSRASKRYQWHPKRPLNAANQNYYIAPVFFEWNVYDLFQRKVEAAIRSDSHVRERMSSHGVEQVEGFRYEIGSADNLNLADGSVDYVFTDPPFGSNIFYGDMNLFQEAWLDVCTDSEHEAVVDRSRGESARGIERYERLITASLKEAFRVLRADGWISIVFSNSQGEMWAVLQRALASAGFAPEEVTLLSKGQRSVKGLASGFENVVTVDLVISAQKKCDGKSLELPSRPGEDLDVLIRRVLDCGAATTPSHLYLRLVRHYLRHGWDLSDLHIRDVMGSLQLAMYGVDAASGQIVSLDQAA
ncbi:MAG TPA: DNA methyltransferase [Solirubrobacterales bacterium]|nr:DNA methyltransferase [Solirubrobacterales bacterium]